MNQESINRPTSPGSQPHQVDCGVNLGKQSLVNSVYTLRVDHVFYSEKSRQSNFNYCQPIFADNGLCNVFAVLPQQFV